jgi:hypothetical protein
VKKRREYEKRGREQGLVRQGEHRTSETRRKRAKEWVDGEWRRQDLNGGQSL